MNNKFDNKLTFGGFIAKKRKDAKLTLREFSGRALLSPSYCSNIESGIRPAPTYDLQKKFAEILKLSESETAIMFDLAAKTKGDGSIPQDVSEYIGNDEDILIFLRQAKKQELNGKNLLKLL